MRRISKLIIGWAMQRMPKRPTRNQVFWGHVYDMLSRFPPPIPVEIRVVAQMPASLADKKKSKRKNRLRTAALCLKDGNRFIITLEEMPVDAPQPYPSRMTWRERVLFDDFLHEYAHVRNWSLIHDKHDCVQFHGGDWGVHFAQLYAAWSNEP